MKKYLLKNFKIVLLFSIGFFVLIIANYWTNLYALKCTIYDLQVQTMRDISNHMNKWLGTKIDALHVTQAFIATLNPDEDKKHIQELLHDSAKLAGFASMFVGYK